MKKLLIIMADQERLGSPPGPHTFKPEHEEILKSAAGKNIEVVIATPEEAKSHYSDAEVVASFPLRMPNIKELPHAKWLHSFSAGVDRILTPAVAESDVILSNSSGIHATPIAEHIIAFMLIWTRGFHKTFRNQEKHAWIKDQTLTELRNSNVLIVGLGEIGTEAARLAHAFGAHVWATVRTLRHGSGQARKKPEFIEKLETSDKLDSMLPEADFVVICLPHTDATHHYFDKEKFAQMKKGAVVINIGRGGIIKEVDLIEALKNGTIAGAGLDVTEKEPLPEDSPLWDMSNVIITPHHSGLSHKYMDRAIDLLSKNLEAYLKDEHLPTQVDKKLGY
jgi:phosphoglycerate dehydrogenase-like enzyme